MFPFSWSEVWIVGNGSSAARLLPTIPRGASVLCLNDAVFRVAALHRFDLVRAVFSLDKDWVLRNKMWLAEFAGEKHVALPLGTFPDCAGIPGVRYYGWSHAEGLSDDPDVIATGQNSGFGAINLAYLRGAKLIHLIGYDMDDEYMRTHWAPFFAHALPQLDAKGVRVLNHNRDSRITAFPFADGFTKGGLVTEYKSYLVGERTCQL